MNTTLRLTLASLLAASVALGGCAVEPEGDDADVAAQASSTGGEVQILVQGVVEIDGLSTYGAAALSPAKVSGAASRYDLNRLRAEMITDGSVAPADRTRIFAALAALPGVGFVTRPATSAPNAPMAPPSPVSPLGALVVTKLFNDSRSTNTTLLVQAATAETPIDPIPSALVIDERTIERLIVQSPSVGERLVRAVPSKLAPAHLAALTAHHAGGAATSDLDPKEMGKLGELVTIYLRERGVRADGGSAEERQAAFRDAMGALLGVHGHVTAARSAEPRFVGTALGIFVGGLLRHYSELEYSAYMRQNFYADVSSSLLNLVSLAHPATAVIAAVLTPFAARLAEEAAPADFQSAARQLEADLRYGLQTDPIRGAGGAAWSEAQRQDALSWMETAIAANGF